jgi:hypothetical protein
MGPIATFVAHVSACLEDQGANLMAPVVHDYSDDYAISMIEVRFPCHVTSGDKVTGLKALM